MTTLTVYGDTADGYVQSSYATYLTARSGPATAAASAALVRVGQETGYTLYEGFIAFDTSSIPDDATITSVTLSLGQRDDQSVTDFTVNARLYDWGATLATGDWVAGASLSANTLLATWSTAGYVDETYANFTSEAAFVSNVSKTGYTRIVLSSSRFEAGTAPTNNEHVYFHGSEEVEPTELRPKLVIEYTEPLTMPTATFQAVATLSGNAMAQNPQQMNTATFQAVASFTPSALSVSTSPSVVDFTKYHSYVNTLGLLWWEGEKAVTRLNAVRPPKTDVGGEQVTIRAETGDRFGMKDFSGGAGQTDFHVAGREENKFYISHGYDISQTDRISHLNQTGEAVDSANIGAPFVVADTPLVIDGNVVKRGNGSWPGTWTDETVGGVTVYSVAVAGSEAYAGVNDAAAPLYLRAAGGTTWAVYQVGGTNVTLGAGACTFLAFLKDRLMCIGGTASRSIYEVTGSTATPTAIRTLPAGWTFERIWEGGRFIYAAAVNANMGLSKLYTFGLNAAGTAIEEKASTNFPRETVIYCGAGYLDAILMAGGVRNDSGGYDPIYLFGQPDDNGLVSWVIVRQEKGSGSTDLSVRAIEPHERSVLIGWSLKAASYGLTAREGLAVHHLARDAFAHHINKQTPAATPNRIKGIAVFKDRILFSVQGDGLYYENIGTPVSQAELISSVADWGDAGFKIWDTMDASYDALPSGTSVTLDYSNVHPEDASWSSAISDSTLGSKGDTVRLSNVKERKFVIRLRSNASGANAPEVRGFAVRSNPAPDEPEWRLIRYFQIGSDLRRSATGPRILQNPDTVRTALMDLAYTWVSLTEDGISYTAWVDDVQLLPPENPTFHVTRGEPHEKTYVVVMSMLGTVD